MDTAATTILAFWSGTSDAEDLEAIPVGAAETLDRAMRDCSCGAEPLVERGMVFIPFERPADAVALGLRIQYRIHEDGGPTLTLRQFGVGVVYRGEAFLLSDNDNAEVGALLTLSSSMARSARPGQVFVTEDARSLAVHTLKLFPITAEDELTPAIYWEKHGRYALGESADSFVLYEVGGTDWKRICSPPGGKVLVEVLQSRQVANSPLSPELISILGLSGNEEVEEVRTVFAEKIRFYETRAAKAVAKPVRLRNEASLRRLRELGSEIENFVETNRISELVESAEKALEAGRLGRVKALLQELLDEEDTLEAAVLKRVQAIRVEYEELTRPKAPEPIPEPVFEEAVPQVKVEEKEPKVAPVVEPVVEAKVIVEKVAEAIPEVPEKAVEEEPVEPVASEHFASCMTLECLGGRRLQVMTAERIRFGRDPSSEFKLHAVSPGDKSATAFANGCMSRQHFEIYRTKDDAVLIDGWRLEDGSVKASSNGMMVNGKMVSESKLHQSSVSSIQVGSPLLSPFLPRWSVTLVDQYAIARVRPAGSRFAESDGCPVAGLYMRRDDVFKEDVLILWDTVNLKHFGLTNGDVWLARKNGGVALLNEGRLDALSQANAHLAGVIPMKVGRLEQVHLAEVF